MNLKNAINSHTERVAARVLARVRNYRSRKEEKENANVTLFNSLNIQLTDTPWRGVARNRFVFLCSLRAAESRVEEPGWGPQPSGEDYARNLLSAGAVHAAHYSNNVNPGIF